MDPITTRPDLNELERIREEVRRCRSVDDLRWYFDRLKRLRPEFQDDFDALYAISALQNETVERARQLNESKEPGSSGNIRKPSAQITTPAASVANPTAASPPPSTPEAAEIAPEVERLDPKVWQRTLYLALFFTVLLFAAFFYLIQTARRLNLVPAQTAQTNTAAPAQVMPNKETVPQQPEPPTKPTVRLYTDLVPGSVTIDGGTPQDLKDGELVLDDLQPGSHSMRVSGAGGSAEFSYEVAENSAPKLSGQPVASNAMTVLVSSENGKAHLITNTDEADIAVDSAAPGHATADGLELDFGKGDHLLQVAQGRDRQRFVWTYTAAPTLTVYVKSDPNAGTVVVLTHEDGADVYINDMLYRRKTEAGQIRIPLKVGEYTIRVHKAGFLDPPPQQVTVKKADETAAIFRMDALPHVATLQVKGALPGTMVFIDGEMAAAIGADGLASISNVKPGDHAIELRRDQAVTKRFDRSFKTGDTILLSGPDAVLEKAVVANTPPPTPPPPPSTAQSQPAAANSDSANNGMQIQGEQVRRGGGFVPYHVPRVAGHYSFAGQVHKSGILHRGKFEWYAGFQDTRNYILFVADGKHVSVHQVVDGKSIEVSRVPLEADADSWIQVDMSVKPNAIVARVKTPDSGWQELGAVESNGRDFTQNNVGVYIPGNDEVAVANFRFSNH